MSLTILQEQNVTRFERTPLLFMLRKLVLTTSKSGGIFVGDALERLADIKFCEPIEAIITLDELGDVIEEIANLRVRIAPNAYEKMRFPAIGKYVRGARSMQELIETFADASGLSWAIYADDTIEIFQGSRGEVQPIQREKMLSHSRIAEAAIAA